MINACHVQKPGLAGTAMIIARVRTIALVMEGVTAQQELVCAFHPGQELIAKAFMDAQMTKIVVEMVVADA